MTQDELVRIVRETGVDAEVGTRQQQYHQVRFQNYARHKSLNLGFRAPEGPFVADFVFLGQDRDLNEQRCDAFMLLFGGKRGPRETVFARLEPAFAEVEFLKQVILAYWAVREPVGA